MAWGESSQRFLDLSCVTCGVATILGPILRILTPSKVVLLYILYHFGYWSPGYFLGFKPLSLEGPMILGVTQFPTVNVFKNVIFFIFKDGPKPHIQNVIIRRVVAGHLVLMGNHLIFVPLIFGWCCMLGLK